MPTAPDPVEVIARSRVERWGSNWDDYTSDAHDEMLTSAAKDLAALEAAGISVAELVVFGEVESDVAGQYCNVPDGVPDGTIAYRVKSGRVAPPKAEAQETDQ